MNQQLIQEKALKLLHAAGIDRPPVDVEEIARSRGIEIRRTPAKDDLSGFLMKVGSNRAVIGVNISHHLNRQRFTIAHELGHFILHDFEDVHVDNIVIKLRNEASRTGEKQEEVQANQFAAELLMPKKFLYRDLSTFAPADLHDDRGMRELAKRYQVSVQAMTTRLTRLGYLGVE